MDFTLFGLVPMLFGAGAPANSPQALLDSVYRPLLAGQYQNLEAHYSPRLQDLVASNLAANAVSPSGQPIDPEAPGIVAFNPFLNGQNALVQNLQVTQPVVQGDTAVALVSFVNFDQPTVLSISMEKAGEQWTVDDIASVGEGEKWLYSWLLQYDPYGQQ